MDKIGPYSDTKTNSLWAVKKVQRDHGYGILKLRRKSYPMIKAVIGDGSQTFFWHDN